MRLAVAAAAAAAVAAVYHIRRRARRAPPPCLDSVAAKQLLAQVDLVCFDCDGVLWYGDEAIAGAADCISAVLRAGKRAVFMTNNSSESRATLLKKFHRLGFTDVTADMIYSSGYATALYLRDRVPKGTRVFAVGADGLVDELRAVGLEVEGGCTYARGKANKTVAETCEELRQLDDTRVSTVVTGFNAFFNYFTLSRAARILQRPGTHFIATNDDRVSPKPGGDAPLMLPGGGTPMAALAHAVSRDYVLIGKPSQFALDAILSEHPGVSRARTLMVGDRLDTDVAFGVAGGLRTLLVFSGCTSREKLAMEAEWLPDVTAESVAVFSMTEQSKVK
jgi:4-nitrophenyl phosphatase